MIELAIGLGVVVVIGLFVIYALGSANLRGKGKFWNR